jgi:hypothetical protein
MPRPALFPEPPRDLPDLSAALATPAYRLDRGEKAKWTRINVKTIDCVECTHLQHETRGAFGPRRQAKWRRALPEGHRLDLCRAHEMAWRERDKTDSA